MKNIKILVRELNQCLNKLLNEKLFRREFRSNMIVFILPILCFNPQIAKLLLIIDDRHLIFTSHVVVVYALYVIITGNFQTIPNIQSIK